LAASFASLVRIHARRLCIGLRGEQLARAPATLERLGQAIANHEMQPGPAVRRTEFEGTAMSLRIVTVRASALSDFLDCPARAEAKHLLGKRCPQSPGALLGTAVHRSTAAFDSSRLNGAQGLSIHDAVGAAVDAIHKPTEDVVYSDNEDGRGFNNPQEVEDVAIALHARYCLEIAPTQQYAAVEVKCERLEITDIGLALTGTTDRVRKIGEGHGNSDLKSCEKAERDDETVKRNGDRYRKEG
jgi:hypothetical protein